MPPLEARLNTPDILSSNFQLPSQAEMVQAQGSVASVRRALSLIPEVADLADPRVLNQIKQKLGIDRIPEGSIANIARFMVWSPLSKMPAALRVHWLNDLTERGLESLATEGQSQFGLFDTQ